MPEDPKSLKAARQAAARSAALRLRVTEAEEQIAVAKGSVAARREGLDALRRREGRSKRVVAAEKALTAAERTLRTALDRRTSIVAELDLHRDRLAAILDALKDPATLLAGHVPVLLLPARIETRFVADELRVRVFPDTVHVDQLERVPTRAEVDAARAYWRERWTTPAGPAAEAVWARHTTGRPVNRFAYVVELVTPRNRSQFGVGEPDFPESVVRSEGPTSAPTASLLPSRWVVVGYRGGEEVVRSVTGPVRDRLAVGPALDDDEGTLDALPDEQEAVALDEASKWIVDYDEAVAAGMAVTIPSSRVQGGLEAGLDLLVVVGVDVGDDPEGTAAAVAELLAAHRSTTGLGFVAPGTPTNATAEETVPPRPLADDPVDRPLAPTPGSAADVVATALGVPAHALLGVGGSDMEVNPLTEHLHTAIWEPTLGYFLRQILNPLVDADVTREVRTHFRKWVRPRGPLPTLRVGRQPLGVLPVISLDRHGGSAGAERTLVEVLRRIRRFWSVGDAGRVGDSGDPTADLVELLGRTPRSGALRVREALGPGFTANSVGAEPMTEMQEALAAFALAIMGVRERAAIVDMTLLAKEEVLPVPLVTGEPSEEPLSPDYVARILAEVRRASGYGRLAADPEDASTLLEALLIQAARQEVVRAGTWLVLDRLELDLPLEVALRDEELHLRPLAQATGPVDRGGEKLQVEAPGTVAAKLSIEPAHLVAREVTALGAGATVADHLAKRPIRELLADLRTRQLGEFRQALEGLVGASTDDLDRTLGEAMDALGHRYDAWATSVATRRIAEVRQRGAKGVHVGGFGWVEDVRPAPEYTSAGYVHAPSIAHATTAAILRSGHLARRGDDREPLAIDLSSERAALAARLLDGLRQGQPLEALLGYRFERALRDLGPTYAAHVRSIRLRHPLPEDAGSEPSGPVEEVAARNVVDGLALARLDGRGRDTLLDAIDVPASRRAGVTSALVSLSDALDAVADALTAESVFQSVLGNTERAAAALDVLDRQGPVPDLGILKTPRTGAGQGHRVLVALDHRSPPTGWRGMADVRSTAEPRVNAWVARAFGDPADYRFAAEILDGEGRVVEVVSVGLTDLRRSPLSLVLATLRGAEQGSELEQSLAWAFNRVVTHPDAASLRALPGPPENAPRGSIGLSGFLDHATRLGGMLGAARPAEVRDFAPDTERFEPTPDVPELTARADAVRSAVAQLSALDPSAMTRARLLSGLRSASALGLPGMQPASEDRDALEGQLSRAVAAAHGLLAALDEIEVRPAASDHAEVARQTARIRAVLGDSQPVVPLVRLPDEVRQALSTSAADPALLGGTVLAAAEWMMDRSRVRPAVGRLWDVLAGAELRGADTDPAGLVVAQAPHRPGSRWIGLPGADAKAAEATSSWVIHRSVGQGRTRFGESMAALVVDQWQEHVPSSEETTGIAFHHDAPGARAPQVALLAAPPVPDAASWTTDALLDTVREAVELTRIRALDLDDLTVVGRFLPATYLAFDLERRVPSLNLAHLIERARIDWASHWRVP